MNASAAGGTEKKHQLSIDRAVFLILRVRRVFRRKLTGKRLRSTGPPSSSLGRWIDTIITLSPILLLVYWIKVNLKNNNSVDTTHTYKLIYYSFWIIPMLISNLGFRCRQLFVYIQEGNNIVLDYRYSQYNILCVFERWNFPISCCAYMIGQCLPPLRSVSGLSIKYWQ